MRWSEAVGELPPDEAARLLNGLTVGLGMLALAARRALREEPVAAVERAAAGAHDALARALALLPEPPAAPDGPARVPDAPALPAHAWPTYLDGRATEDGTALRELLLEAVTLARRAGDAIIEDSGADAVVEDAERTLAALAAFLDRLIDPPRPPHR